MKAVDKGLVKLRQSFVNQTDTNSTEPAINSLSNIINHGMEMVDHVLNQTTIYSVGEKPENFVEEVKQDFFHNDTGQVNLPQDPQKDSSIVTILKLADQEVLDIVKYFTREAFINHKDRLKIIKK